MSQFYYYTKINMFIVSVTCLVDSTNILLNVTKCFDADSKHNTVLMKLTKVLNLTAVGSVDLYCRVHVHLTFHKIKGIVNY